MSHWVSGAPVVCYLSISRCILLPVGASSWEELRGRENSKRKLGKKKRMGKQVIWPSVNMLSWCLKVMVVALISNPHLVEWRYKRTPSWTQAFRLAFTNENLVCSHLSQESLCNWWSGLAYSQGISGLSQPKYSRSTCSQPAGALACPAVCTRSTSLSRCGSRQSCRSAWRLAWPLRIHASYSFSSPSESRYENCSAKLWSPLRVIHLSCWLCSTGQEPELSIFQIIIKPK